MLERCKESEKFGAAASEKREHWGILLKCAKRGQDTRRIDLPDNRHRRRFDLASASQTKSGIAVVGDDVRS